VSLFFAKLFGTPSRQKEQKITDKYAFGTLDALRSLAKHFHA